MAKKIVFCADGTWNGPGQDENEDGRADQTNVYKLFLCLAGSPSFASLREADEQEKELTEGGGVRQVAKYIHGVGDSRNPIHRVMGGAFGAGTISRIVRGYTFISRNYEPGDEIYIVGFSRGAYTARALAGLIASQGVLAGRLTGDRELAYRKGAQAWYRYRRSTLADFSLASLAEIVTDLPAFLSTGLLESDDLVEVEQIAAVGVWDTVGAMGIPEFDHGRPVDAFKFCDRRLSSKVLQGFHAVSLDERRRSFTPTLWDRAPNVTQRLFAGAHADVGGGYPRTGGESGLSDCALKWMIRQLARPVSAELPASGVLFETTPECPLSPNPAGTAHKPWDEPLWKVLGPQTRRFPGWLQGHPSLVGRAGAGGVVANPGERARPYEPKNVPGGLDAQGPACPEMARLARGETPECQGGLACLHD